MISLRPYQREILNAQTITAILLWLVGEGPRPSCVSALIVAPTGSGKCLGRGTTVLLHDGRVRPVEEIKAGDLLMGPDSKPRRVISTCSGSEMMYRVTPVKGDPYVVNESHILSLKLTPAGGGERVGVGGKMYLDGDIVNLPVMEYMGASRTFRHRAKGWRVGVDFPTSKTPLLLDPYFLGVWLGDGSSRTSSVTTGDPEILEYVRSYSVRLNGVVRIEENSPGSVMIHMIEKARTGRGGTAIMNSLRFYHLIQNKHIPLEFLTASRQDRLELLAGVMDTDGYYSGNDFELTLSSERLIDDVIFLARSLGFACYKSAIQKTCCNNGSVGEYFRISINGPIEQIPCKVARKKAAPRQQKKDPLVTGITVDAIGPGEYFGFELDGPDRLFLLGDFTVTHNTVMFAAICKYLAEHHLRVLILVHRREIMEQTRRKLYEMGIIAGLIAPGFPPTADLVQVAMIQTLVRRLSNVRRPDLILPDEAHHVLPDNSHGRALGYWSEVPRIGWTATPCRLDNAGLSQSFDALVPGPQVADLVREGWLSYPIVYRPPTNIPTYKVKRGDFDTEEQGKAVMARAIVGDVVSHYRKHLDGLPTICFCPNVESSILMAEQFCAAGYRARPVYGDMPDRERDAALGGLATGDVQVVMSCDLINEGFDTPAVAGIIKLRKTLSLGLNSQQDGRSLRPVFPEGFDPAAATAEERRAAQAEVGKPCAKILDHVGNCFLHGLPMDRREWSLNAGKYDPRKEKPPTTTSCPRCYGVWPGSPKKCPACGYVFAETPERKFKPFDVIAGELVEAMPELPPQDAASMAGFLARMQKLDAKTRSRAMLGKAFELAPGGEEGRRRLALLSREVGYKPGWVRWAQDMVRRKKGA